MMPTLLRRAGGAQFPPKAGLVAYIGASDCQFVTAASTTVTLPSSIIAGDILVMHVMTRSALTVPPGWTLVDQVQTTTSVQYGYLLMKIAESADALATLTISQASAVRMAAHVQVFRGAGMSILGTAKAAVSGTATNVVVFPTYTAPSGSKMAVVGANSWLALTGGTPSTVTLSSPWALTSPLSVSDAANQLRLAAGYQTTSAGASLSGSATLNFSDSGTNFTNAIIATLGVDAYWSNAVLAMNMDGADGSAAFVEALGHAISVVGSVALSTTSPMVGKSSARFPGAGSYLSVPNSSDWAFGAGEFTVESFVKFSSTPTNSCIAAQWGASVPDQAWALYIASGSLYFRFYDAVSAVFRDTSIAWSPVANQRYHVAADRDASGTVRLYIDGAVVASSTGLSQTINVSTQPLLIGAVGGYLGTFELNGWLDNVRATKGKARYAGAFTPVIAPLPTA